jgi:hypothetical protein
MSLDLRLFLLICTALFLANTSGATGHSPGTEASPLAEHMRLHFTAIRAIKSFVISGQLDGVYDPADWLQKHETTSDLPENWSPYVAEMRSYAEELKSARHLVFAAAALGQMARVCGDCHAANDVAVKFPDSDQRLPTGDSVRAQMRRHLWATDRMWEGLIGPSPAAWQAGSEVLAGIQLQASALGGPVDRQPTLDYLLKRLREIGQEGLEANTPGTRSALYGDFLSLCGDCHALTGRGPGPPRTVKK